MKPRFCAALVAVLLSASAGPVRAEMISYSFQGTDTLLGGPGVPVSGSLTYDTHATVLPFMATPGGGVINAFSTTGSITISRGFETFSTPPASNLLVQLTPGGIAFLYHLPPPGHPSTGLLDFTLAIGDQTSTLFGDVSSLPPNLSLAGTSGRFKFLAQSGDPETMGQGVLTSLTPILTIAAVPEPGTLGLAAAGLAGLALASRRRARR
jgi:hypothetical protein